jgi:hypothetical protein
MEKERKCRNKPIYFWSLGLKSKSMPRIHNGERTVFKECYWENCISTCRRMKMGLYLIHYIGIKNQLEVYQHLNVGPETVK